MYNTIFNKYHNNTIVIEYNNNDNSIILNTTITATFISGYMILETTWQ